MDKLALLFQKQYELNEEIVKGFEKDIVCTNNPEITREWIQNMG